MYLRALWASGLLLVFMACGAPSRTFGGDAAGAEGKACFANGTCNTNLVCLSNVCVSLGTGTGGVSSGGGSGKMGGAPMVSGGAENQLSTGGTGGVSIGGSGGVVSSASGGSGGLGGSGESGGVQSGGSGGVVRCEPKLLGTLRDFNSKESTVNPHADFEEFIGEGITKGLVMPNLGADGSPVYADPQPPGSPQLTSADNFKLWYSTAHPANATIQLDLDAPPVTASLVKTVLADGSTEYASTSFFPIDGMGTQALDKPWGENKDADGVGNVAPLHNYHFTFELNTKFIYKKGQVFSFFGDDDVWVFIDKKLAVDVGGLHSQEMGSVMLDTLGLVENSEYDLNVFHAERRTTTSNFKATTNITFSNCGIVLR